MKYYGIFPLSVFFSVLFLLSLPPALSSLETPVISTYLTDKAGIFDPESAAKFEQALRALETETAGVQYVVYVEKALPAGTTLEEYALAIAEKNKIGKGGKDNGLLLYVAIDDRLYRWEVGYGVESTLSTPLLGRISREYLVPNFREGNYALGILEASRVVGSLLLNSTDPDIVKLKTEENSAGFTDLDAMIMIVFFLVIGGFVCLSIIAFVTSLFLPLGKGKKSKGSRSLHNTAATAIFLSSFGRGGGFGSGGFSGGGFSGGGGGFGGGGFSGRW
ncbi:MAG: TPM domain-containing protein [archaeon]